MSYLRWLSFQFCGFSFLFNTFYAHADPLTEVNAKTREMTLHSQSNTFAEEQSIGLAKQYIKENKGKDALQVLSPYLISTTSYDIFLLTAQSYAEINNPSVAIDFYQKARELADTDERRQIANQGIAKMQY